MLDAVGRVPQPPLPPQDTECGSQAFPAFDAAGTQLSPVLPGLLSAGFPAPTCCAHAEQSVLPIHALPSRGVASATFCFSCLCVGSHCCRSHALPSLGVTSSTHFLLLPAPGKYLPHTHCPVLGSQAAPAACALPAAAAASRSRSSSRPSKICWNVAGSCAPDSEYL